MTVALGSLDQSKAPGDEEEVENCKHDCQDGADYFGAEQPVGDDGNGDDDSRQQNSPHRKSSDQSACVAGSQRKRGDEGSGAWTGAGLPRAAGLGGGICHDYWKVFRSKKGYAEVEVESYVRRSFCRVLTEAEFYCFNRVRW